MSSIAVMQPYFLPYSGYFSLIDSVDKFIFFDDVQYVRKSWMSRNRLLNLSTGEPFYIRPGIVKPPYKAPLLSVELKRSSGWVNKLLEQTATYKNDVPFYDEVVGLLENILSNEYKYLVELNIDSTIMISKKLGLDTEFEKYSDYDFWFDEKPKPGTWGLKIAESLETDTYINSPGGESFISDKGFAKRGINLGFIQPQIDCYDQKGNDFVPRLSIFDVLFFNGLKKTKKYVKDYRIKWMNSNN